MIDLGTTTELAFVVTDDSGAAVNPDTATMTVTLPDLAGTQVNVPVTLPPATTGLLTADYATTAEGRHVVSLVTTNPGRVYTDVFNVRVYEALIGLAEAKAHLNITRPQPDNDAELRRFIMACTELIESKVGVCMRRSFTDRIWEGGRSIVLPRRPVLAVTSVTSVWPGGPSWAAADVIPDLEAGLLVPALPLFPFWYGPWDVVYQCGRLVIPERWLHACKEQLRHLWETQRGSQPPAVLSGEEEFTTTTGWSFSVPRRVLELLEQDMVPSS